ncbi:helix-turn-helix transcriptional regulator [Actinomadura rupiterrae]|uniref:helix-turn-helix transcriptional regulator n=1 Tax=Actinomadura rupiterrae TaxID=559627 RepID=UPI0020A40B78|nr:WYL domain-containing protein [Actinomadura rupiterrae]MCP2342293.1 proteasome accessory factor B [Actinomadura rupiterrae]
MNRTDRLYALVEELRAVAPRPRTVPWLAARFEVSVRTVQRDLQALMGTSVPLRCEPGPRGGWFVDPAMTLPPVNFTADEAVALAVAVAGAESGAPFAGPAGAAMRKLTAVMPREALDSLRLIARQIRLTTTPIPSGVRAAVEDAVSGHRVLALRYGDAAGTVSEREVEPAGLLSRHGQWYLIGWCRTRRAVRAFRLDRIQDARLTSESAPARDLAGLADVATVAPAFLGGMD